MEGESRFRQRLAGTLAVAAILEATAVAGLSTAHDPRFTFDDPLVAAGFLGIVALFPVMGALIIQRRPGTRVAWLMIALGLALGLGLVFYAYGVLGYGGDHPMPLAIWALVVSQLFFIPSLGTATTLILLLFPTDRFVGPRWRIVGAIAVLASVLYVASTLVRPGELDSNILPGVVNPIAVQADLAEAAVMVTNIANLAGVLGLLLASASLVVRYRRADPVEAAQIRWLALVGVLAAVAFLASITPVDWLADPAFGIGVSLLACMPIAIGIAITRYRLYEIDRLINRTLVYGSLTAILAGVFTAGVGLAQRMFVAATHETSDAAVVGATLVVATLYAPLRKRLEAIVDRRFKFEHARFGAYRDELTRLLSATDVHRAAERLVREAVQDLPALGGATLGADGSVTATAGQWPVEPLVRMTIPGGGGPMRILAIGPRPDGELHPPGALAALEEIAGLAAAAALLRHDAGSRAGPSPPIS